MKTKSKLKLERVQVVAIWFVLAALLTTALSIVENELFDTHYVAWLYGVLFLGFGYWFYRVIYMPHAWSRALIFILYILIGTAAWHYELAEHYDTFLSPETYNLHIAVFLGVAVFLIPYMFYHKSRMKTRYRKLFELAAQPVDSLFDGYSSRPYPAGKREFTRDEVLKLGKFLEKSLIAVKHELEGRILFSFSASSTLGKPDPEKGSYISFEDGGNVTVILRKEDYSMYKGQYSFEELCQSMANMFLGFLDDSRAGREEEILQRLEATDPPIVKILLLGFSVILLVGVVLSFLLWFRNV